MVIVLFELQYVSNVTHHSFALNKKLASCWPVLCVIRKTILFDSLLHVVLAGVIRSAVLGPVHLSACGLVVRMCCLIKERLTKIVSWEMEKKGLPCIAVRKAEIFHTRLWKAITVRAA